MSYRAFYELHLQSFFKLSFLEIVMNSLSSILSYNNFDFEPIFNNGGKSKIVRKVRHESTLTKQMIYFFMFTILNAGYLIISCYTFAP